MECSTLPYAGRLYYWNEKVLLHKKYSMARSGTRSYHGASHSHSPIQSKATNKNTKTMKKKKKKKKKKEKKKKKKQRLVPTILCTYHPRYVSQLQWRKHFLTGLFDVLRRTRMKSGGSCSRGLASQSLRQRYLAS